MTRKLVLKDTNSEIQTKFQHFVLTKFNVRVNYKSLGKSTLGLNPDWLEHRFKLFDRFCYPSLRKQFNQKFQWLVFFDTKTPTKFKDKVREYTAWQNFIPVYVDRDKYSPGGLVKPIIRQYLQQDAEYLITTRIDNDDGVALDFINLIQENFSRQKMQFVNFNYGYVWHQQKIYLLKEKSNHFTSLIEKIDRENEAEIKTIYCANHSNLKLQGNIKQLDIAPTWLEVIHDRNVVNRVRGIRQPISKLDRRFTLNVPISQSENPWLYWWDRLQSSLNYYRKAIFSKGKQILMTKI